MDLRKNIYEIFSFIRKNLQKAPLFFSIQRKKLFNFLAKNIFNRKKKSISKDFSEKFSDAIDEKFSDAIDEKFSDAIDEEFFDAIDEIDEIDEEFFDAITLNEKNTESEIIDTLILPHLTKESILIAFDINDTSKHNEHILALIANNRDNKLILEQVTKYLGSLETKFIFSFQNDKIILTAKNLKVYLPQYFKDKIALQKLEERHKKSILVFLELPEHSSRLKKSLNDGKIYYIRDKNSKIVDSSINIGYKVIDSENRKFSKYINEHVKIESNTQKSAEMKLNITLEKIYEFLSIDGLINYGSGKKDILFSMISSFSSVIFPYIKSFSSKEGSLKIKEISFLNERGFLQRKIINQSSTNPLICSSIESISDVSPCSIGDTSCHKN